MIPQAPRCARAGLLLALAVAAPAHAHALLEGTTPERGARSTRRREQVVLRFSEAVEVAVRRRAGLRRARARRSSRARRSIPGGRGQRGRRARCARPARRRLHGDLPRHLGRLAPGLRRVRVRRRRGAGRSARRSRELLEGAGQRAGHLGRVRRPRARCSSPRSRWRSGRSPCCCSSGCRRWRALAVPERRWRVGVRGVRRPLAQAARSPRARRGLVSALRRCRCRPRRPRARRSGPRSATRASARHALRHRLGPRGARLAAVLGLARRAPRRRRPRCGRDGRAAGVAVPRPGRAVAALALPLLAGSCCCPALGGHAGVQDPVARAAARQRAARVAASRLDRRHRDAGRRAAGRDAALELADRTRLLSAARRPVLDARARSRWRAADRRHRPVAARARALSTTCSTPRTAARSSSRSCSSPCCSASAPGTGGARCRRSPRGRATARPRAAPGVDAAPRAARRGRARRRRARRDRARSRATRPRTRRRPARTRRRPSSGPRAPS